MSAQFSPERMKNPIDLIERLAAAHDWSCDRTNDDELTLVNSGLEDTMAAAYDQLRETRRLDPKIPDLRTAAFVNAIDKVARSYMELGIFP